MNTTTQKVLTLNLDPFQMSLHSTHVSLTLNMDLTPIGMSTSVIKAKSSTKKTYNKPNDHVEIDDLIRDARVSDALRYALKDLWTVNPSFLIHHHYRMFSRDHKTNHGTLLSLTTKYYHSCRYNRTDSQSFSRYQKTWQ